eukprot:GHVQ01042836.1.p1 GENE.GHVQ01042836.1~~GHVQ01042836.1.p1  ORF type:complete len:283 (-),score=19.90 GHVQ01042836.1:321-1169(-)
MPKNLSLFGKYLRYVGEGGRKSFKRRNITQPIPVKAYGRPPSAASQTGLYHDEDYNYYTKVSFSLNKTRKKLKPAVFRKDFYSESLNCMIRDLRVTTSALHAMDDAGGLDQYILRTPPEELRSQLGERMRSVMHFYQENPQLKAWGLPWKVFLRQRAREDPYYARHLHFLHMERNNQELHRKVAKHSPYYLPPSNALTPERQRFTPGSEPPAELNLWWNKSRELAEAFRRRLGEAKPFERAHADHREELGFRTGRRIGGGGRSGGTVHKRNKNFTGNDIRSY